MIATKQRGIDQDRVRITYRDQHNHGAGQVCAALVILTLLHIVTFSGEPRGGWADV